MSTCNLNCSKPDLAHIASHVRNAEYNPQRFCAGACGAPRRPVPRHPTPPPRSYHPPARAQVHGALLPVGQARRDGHQVRGRRAGGRAARRQGELSSAVAAVGAASNPPLSSPAGRPQARLPLRALRLPHPGACPALPLCVPRSSADPSAPSPPPPQNMVASGDVGFPIRLEGLADEHVKFASVRVAALPTPRSQATQRPYPPFPQAVRARALPRPRLPHGRPAPRLPRLRLGEDRLHRRERGRGGGEWPHSGTPHALHLPAQPPSRAPRSSRASTSSTPRSTSSARPRSPSRRPAST